MTEADMVMTKAEPNPQVRFGRTLAPHKTHCYDDNCKYQRASHYIPLPSLELRKPLAYVFPCLTYYLKNRSKLQGRCDLTGRPNYGGSWPLNRNAIRASMLSEFTRK